MKSRRPVLDSEDWLGKKLWTFGVHQLWRRGLARDGGFSTSTGAMPTTHYRCGASANDVPRHELPRSLRRAHDSVVALYPQGDAADRTLRLVRAAAAASSS